MMNPALKPTQVMLTVTEREQLEDIRRAKGERSMSDAIRALIREEHAEPRNCDEATVARRLKSA